MSDAEQHVREFTRIWLVPGRDAIERIHADRAYELRASDLDEVLRLLDEARGFADITQALANIDQLTRERDEAREQLWDAREANQIMREAERRRREEQPCGRSFTHPPHRWMSARRTVQCPGVGEYGPQPAQATTLTDTTDRTTNEGN